MSRTRRVNLSFAAALIAVGITGGPSTCWAQNQMAYMLLEGSTLTDDCPICGRPALIMPLRGTFLLAFREENPLFTTYDVREIGFQTSSGTSTYVVTGGGTYEIGGEVALVQRMELNVQINDRPDIELKTDDVPLGRTWPMIEIDVREPEDPPNPWQVFYMHIVAAPVREIWFSTRSGFTSGTGRPSGSGGDLLSHVGRVVKRNSDLVGKLGIMPMVPDLGLDAVDIGPGGEVLFSMEEDRHSETLGPLQDGDLLSDHGRIVRTNQELTSAFVPEPPAPDVGLDAVQVMEDGEILFSISFEEGLFSEALGALLRRGDLLSDRGIIVRTNEQLLANFEPVEKQGDVGLDAIHVWPSGEIWFSTEVGFQSKRLGIVCEGDLLSDNGSIVFRNLELLQAFGPIEDLADFGLDALFLPTEGYVTKPSLREITLRVDGGSGNLLIEWVSDGRVFQVERADEPGGPYIPLGPISPETTYMDPAALLKNKSFYRMRLW